MYGGEPICAVLQVAPSGYYQRRAVRADSTEQSPRVRRDAFGIGVDATAEMLIVAGDNPTRIRSEAAFAKLCGASPIPASSGVTHRHRLSRGGHRQANAALYRIVIVRLRWHQATID